MPPPLQADDFLRCLRPGAVGLLLSSSDAGLPVMADLSLRALTLDEKGRVFIQAHSFNDLGEIIQRQHARKFTKSIPKLADRMDLLSHNPEEFPTESTLLYVTEKPPLKAKRRSTGLPSTINRLKEIAEKRKTCVLLAEEHKSGGRQILPESTYDCKNLANHIDFCFGLSHLTADGIPLKVQHLTLWEPQTEPRSCLIFIDQEKGSVDYQLPPALSLANFIPTIWED